MFEPDESFAPGTAELEHIHRRAPAGAFALAGSSTAIVFALWLAFYLLVFLPRGMLE